MRDVVRDILPIYSGILPDLGHQTRSSSDEVQALAATTYHHLHRHTQLSALALKKLALAGGRRAHGRLRKRRLEVRPKYVAEYTQNRPSR